MMKKLVAFIFIFLLTTIALAQVKDQKRDQLLLKLRNTSQDTSRLATLIALAQYYYDLPDKSGKPDSTGSYLERARQLNQKLRITDDQNEIDILSAKIKCDRNPGLDANSIFLPVINECKVTGDMKNELAGILGMTKKMPDVPQNYPFWLTCYQSALTLTRKLNDKQTELTVLKNIADLHLRQNRLEPAEKELLQIISNPKASPDQLLWGYDGMTNIYTLKGQYNKALYYGFKTLRSMKTAEDSLSAVTFFGRLRLIYANLGDPARSNIWAKKAFEYLAGKKQYEILPFVRGSIATNLIGAGKPQEALNFVLTHNLLDKIATPRAMMLYHRQLGECYFALKNYGLAEKNYLELLHLIRKGDKHLSPIDEATYYQIIGGFYVHTSRGIEAKPYLLKSLQEAKAVGYVSSLKDNYLLLFKADSAAGQFQSAIKYLQLGNRLKDSIFSSEKSKQIEELQVAYDTEQKNKNIQQLQTTAKVQKLQLIQADSTRNWIIAGSCLILVIAGLLLRQAVSAKKSNTAISRKNETLQQLVNEKEWLLKEVHHRVKNNLHTVICLLESQAKYLENDALHAIESSQQRIFAMSLIHQKLYRSEDIKTIDMADYIPELIRNLEESFGVGGDIAFKYEIAQITLSIAYAIPIGLIINEAVTNSIKYAFRQRKGGEIIVSLGKKDNEIRLEMADNGVGIPKELYDRETRTLGIELMKGLSEDINGNIHFEVADGTRIVIKFEPAIL